MKSKIYYILNVFLFYSILGNLFERCAMYFIDRSYVSGFMGSIFTPIYGIAILIVLFLHKKIRIKNLFFKLIVEFLVYLVVLSILEYIGGFIIECFFNKVYWNYDKFKYNIGLYVSLEISLIWGLLSIATLYLIHPVFNKIESRIPKIITILISFIFIINLLLVVIK